MAGAGAGGNAVLLENSANALPPLTGGAMLAAESRELPPASVPVVGANVPYASAAGSCATTVGFKSRTPVPLS